MAYFKINSTDFSNKVSGLNVSRTANYNSQTNAAGNTVVDYINHKYEIEVEIIPLTAADMQTLQGNINSLSVTIDFLNPLTGSLIEGLECIVPENEVEYYTIQTNNVSFNAAKLTFIQL